MVSFDAFDRPPRTDTPVQHRWYRSRPEKVEARALSPDTRKAILRWLTGCAPYQVMDAVYGECVMIYQPSGEVMAKEGDMIVRMPDGRYIAMSRAEFDAAYEAV